MSAQRLGVAGAAALVIVGVLYVVVIALWLVKEATPSEPIGDPYLAVMEVLTIASALALLAFVVALERIASLSRPVPALAALVFGALAAGLTMTVHFVQLTAVRQLWRAGQLADYRLVWPSALFAVEYFVWDVLVGLTLLCAAIALPQGARAARAALLAAGCLCVLGVVGPVTGRMLLQNIAVAGYALVLPVAAALCIRVLRSPA